MGQKYSDIRESLGDAIDLILKELESSERKLEMLGKRVAELERMIAGKGTEEKKTVEPDAEPAGIKDEEDTVAGIAVDDGSKVFGELFTVPQAIGDTARDRFSWYTDMPGEKVDDVNLAISLNDRLFFIRELFAGDDVQFQLMMDRINESASFEDVLMDMRTAFPEWDEESEPVYRFYMAVRRRFA